MLKPVWALSRSASVGRKYSSTHWRTNSSRARRLRTPSVSASNCTPENHWSKLAGDLPRVNATASLHIHWAPSFAPLSVSAFATACPPVCTMVSASGMRLSSWLCINACIESLEAQSTLTVTGFTTPNHMKTMESDNPRHDEGNKLPTGCGEREGHSSDGLGG